MQECSERTFDNKIGSVKLSSVNISELEKRCFHGVGELGVSSTSGVHITSSSLGTVHREAFSGSMKSIKLQENTEVGSVTENGFQVDVKDFCIEDSKIGTLSSGSLSVTFMDTFSVKEVGIEHLRKGAFRGVKATPHRTPTVSLDALVIENAEPGSLSFQRCLHVEASDLDIQSSDVERCPTEQWTRGLMGLDAQQKVFADVYSLYSCLHDSNSPCVKDTKRWQTLLVEDSSCDYATGKEDEKIDSNVHGQEKGANVDWDDGEKSVGDQQGSFNRNVQEENKTDASKSKGANETQRGDFQTEDEIRREADAAVEDETDMEEKKGTGKESDTSGGQANDDRTSTHEQDPDARTPSANSPLSGLWPVLIVISFWVLILGGAWCRRGRPTQTIYRQTNADSQGDFLMGERPRENDAVEQPNQ
ncbi:uncharacterized protein LOC122383053 [Amphibalanus amphitrite]|uniref:uncharacterized protein LOC122383053 n=1 Tax=Amphibalanus amphitrite TaxID=1232801 RepID=UPI001C9023DD|nr:uncharacterized protein LOC122383053 [Amphibalanus amphitrite]